MSDEILFPLHVAAARLKLQRLRSARLQSSYTSTSVSRRILVDPSTVIASTRPYTSNNKRIHDIVAAFPPTNQLSFLKSMRDQNINITPLIERAASELPLRSVLPSTLASYNAGLRHYVAFCRLWSELSGTSFGFLSPSASMLMRWLATYRDALTQACESLEKEWIR